MAKVSQLQIRVSAEQKARIRRGAHGARTDMSSWVLSRLFPREEESFQQLVSQLGTGETPSLVFAQIHDFLANLPAAEFPDAVATRPATKLGPYFENYLAAMVECAATSKGVDPPAWLSEIEPLATPVFGAALDSIRLHLLTHSPPPFRRRNIFIDASIGDRA